MSNDLILLNILDGIYAEVSDQGVKLYINIYYKLSTASIYYTSYFRGTFNTAIGDYIGLRIDYPNLVTNNTNSMTRNNNDETPLNIDTNRVINNGLISMRAVDTDSGGNYLAYVIRNGGTSYFSYFNNAYINLFKQTISKQLTFVDTSYRRNSIGGFLATTIFVLVLPPVSSSNGKLFIIKDKTGNANNNNIHIIPDDPTQNIIDNTNVLTLNRAYQSVILTSDGTQWWILAGYNYNDNNKVTNGIIASPTNTKSITSKSVQFFYSNDNTSQLNLPQPNNSIKYIVFYANNNDNAKCNLVSSSGTIDGISGINIYSGNKNKNTSIILISDSANWYIISYFNGSNIDIVQTSTTDITKTTYTPITYYNNSTQFKFKLNIPVNYSSSEKKSFIIYLKNKTVNNTDYYFAADSNSCFINLVNLNSLQKKGVTNKYDSFCFIGVLNFLTNKIVYYPIGRWAN